MICIHCGKQIKDGSKFCGSCGESQQQTQGMVSASATGYQGHLIANNLTQNVKHFEGLYTQIAVSESGIIALYFPYVPATKGGLFKGEGSPEQLERFEVLHISQIIDFDFDVDGVEETKVSSGLGGALIGGFLGGAVGSIIGSAATSGKVKTNTTINGVTLLINTKDFNNPRIEIPLYSRFDPPNRAGGNMRTPPEALPPALRPHYRSSGIGYYIFDKEGAALARDVYNNGEPNLELIETLQSTLTQMLAAHQQSELAASVAPQISAADELVKFKGLLDIGVITQEEFDAKKKQLLGL